MSIQTETETLVKESSPRPGPAAPLSEKVRSLRISHTPAQASGSVFPWLVCLAWILQGETESTVAA